MTTYYGMLMMINYVMKELRSLNYK